jgi:hypothetical protein
MGMKRQQAILLVVVFAGTSVYADTPVPPKESKTIPLPTGQLNSADWLKASTAPLQPGEIDRLVGANLKKANVQPAPTTTDEEFIRRVTLDLTGRLPLPERIAEFLGDTNPNRRAQLIDTLLASDEFARHWALYFREVISSRTTDQKVRLFSPHFEKWLANQFKANASWAKITRDILTATGPIRAEDIDKNGQAFFLGSRFGPDAPMELAAETSRIFLGIQIQCAQCHDHPSDVWKRQQFHEFAAFFVRVKDRPLREEMKFAGQELVSLPFAEHRMPGKDDPKKGTPVAPKFIDGKVPKTVRFSPTDTERRQALADFITSKDDPWFAGAFVNRIWGELMGQSFYQPIDDMGPQKDAVMPMVLARIAGAFRGSDYDIKRLFRDITNSQTYQRQIRPGEAGADHLLFAASNPTRMSADAIWQALIGTLGPLNPPAGSPALKKLPKGPLARLFGPEAAFKQEFGFDPSTKSDEVEGSVTQALLMMNNPLINQKIMARGTNTLARLLSTYSQDDEAVRALYVRTMARRPTDRELARCQEHIHSANTRAAAYEDILWALINSTEFQTKR